MANPRIAFILAAICVCALSIAPRAFGANDSADNRVVVELFTSQGCSSCPPADRLLSTIGTSAQFANQVVPLSFNVDYWNRLGWTDPFSDHRWSERQEAYAESIRGESSVYTPELVVNGRRECVGSDASRAAALIESARQDEPLGNLRLTMEPDGAQAIKLMVGATLLKAPPAGDWHVMVAIFERGLSTKVERGENGGSQLANDFVVRRLIDAFAADPHPGTPVHKTLVVSPDPSWNRAKIGAAAFLQDSSTLAIRGAIVRYPAVVSSSR